MHKHGEGRPTVEGGQVQIGGNESYVALCRSAEWRLHGESIGLRRSPPLLSLEFQLDELDLEIHGKARHYHQDLV